MASTFQSDAVTGARPSIDCAEAGEVKAVRGTYDLAAALVVNDVIELVKIPQGHVIVDAIVDCDDLDSDGSPAIVMDFGEVGGDVDALIAASTVGQAGGLARMDQKTGPRLIASSAEMTLGAKVTTAPATGATTGTIGLTVLYRPANFGA